MLKYVPPKWSIGTLILFGCIFMIFNATVAAASLSGIGLAVYFRQYIRNLFDRIFRRNHENNARIRFQKKWRSIKNDLGRRLRHYPIYIVTGPNSETTKNLLLAANFQEVGSDIDVSIETDDSDVRLWLGQSKIIIEMPESYWKKEYIDDLNLILHFFGKIHHYKRFYGAIICWDICEIDSTFADRVRLKSMVSLLTSRLRQRLPIYFLFTGCDKIPGFTSCFSKMPKHVTQKVWGFALDDCGTWVEQIQNEFDNLMKSLHQFSIQYLAFEKNAVERIRMFLFPKLFSRVEYEITNISKECFGELSDKTSPMLRGVYFCCTDENVLNDMSQDIKLLSASTLNSTQIQSEQYKESRKYFIDGFFHDVLEHDRSVDKRLEYGGWRGLLRFYRMPAVISVLLIFIVLFQVVSAFENEKNLRSIDRNLEKLREISESDPDSQSVMMLAGEMDDFLRIVEKKKYSSFLSYERMGMNFTNVIEYPMRKLFVNVLNSIFVSEIFLSDAEQLNKFSEEINSNKITIEAPEVVTSLNRLKMHLMLSYPKNKNEPSHMAVKMWTQNMLKESLTKNRADIVTVDTERTIESSIASYVDIVLKYPELGFYRDSKCISRIREVLSHYPEDILFIKVLEDEFMKSVNIDDISLSSIMAHHEVPWEGSVFVPAVYTKKGWTSFVNSWMQSQAVTNDAWVLSDKYIGKLDINRIIRSIRNRYYRRYIEQWYRFLDDINIVPAKNADQCLTVFNLMTRGDISSIRKLGETILENTDIQYTQVSGNSKGGIIDGIKQFVLRTNAQDIERTQKDIWSIMTMSSVDVEHWAKVRDEFSMWHKIFSRDTKNEVSFVDLYQEQMLDIRQSLQDYTEDRAEVDTVQRAIREARHKIDTAISRNSSSTKKKSQLERILILPIVGLEDAMTRSHYSMTNDYWCYNVVKAYRTMKDSYPFQRSGVDAPITDIADFFHPDRGILWRFYKQNLAHDLIQNGDNFDIRPYLGVASNYQYSKNIIEYLNRARRFSNILFANTQSSSSIGMGLSMKPVTKGPIKRIHLEIDGQDIISDISEINMFQNVQWPGPKQGFGVRMQIIDENGHTETLRYEGPWGLFRLIESGMVRGDPGNGHFTIEWPLTMSDGRVQVDVRLLSRTTLLFGDGGDRPFGYLREGQMSPPEKLAEVFSKCL